MMLFDAQKSRELRIKIDGCVATAKDRKIFAEVELLVEKIFDSKTQSHELCIRKMNQTFLTRTFDISEKKEGEWKGIVLELEEGMKRFGYRDTRIFTFQESVLRSDLITAGGFPRNPYRPYILIVKDATLEEAGRARELEAVAEVPGKNLGLNEKTAAITLEPLGVDGNTLRPPRRINVSLLSEALRTGTPLDRAFELCAVELRQGIVSYEPRNGE